MIGEAPRTYTLPQILSEMDQALADEIKEQSSRRSADYTAVDGKLIAEESGRFIYVFSLKDPWDPEDDTPVRIKISGAPLIKGTIVTSTGTMITIATEVKLPPEGLRQIELVNDATELLERLREALKDNNEGPTQMGSKAFGLCSFTSGKRSKYVSSETFELDPFQKQAIEMALGSEVLYLIGPPGTGKTSTLAEMASIHLREGRTVLIAAHTNIAVDNAIMKLADICKVVNANELRVGHIVRYGTPQDRRLMDDDRYADVYLPKIAKRMGSDLHRQSEQLKASLEKVVELLVAMKQVQNQGKEQQQAEKEGFGKQREALRQSITLLQVSEVQYRSSLDMQLNNVGRLQQQVQQKASTIQQELQKMVAQQVQMQTVQSQHQSDVNLLSLQLAEAQQMNAVKRLLKRIDPKRIEQQLVEAKQQSWRDGQLLTELQGRMNMAHHSYETATQEVNQLTSNYSKIKTQRDTPSDDAKQIARLQVALAQYEEKIKAIDSSLERERKDTEQRQHQLEGERAKIEEQMATIDKQIADLEKNIVAQARVVATTLSKIYMSKSLSERRFDVVILDEVSMAPLPAVYVAASHADQSVVAIGDPKQLAPIATAKDKSPFVQQWLATDLFVHRGITLEIAESGARNSTLLGIQSRMNPFISVIARKHVYNGLIKDREGLAEKWKQYAQVKPLPEEPLLLCDTSDAMPFATRPEGGSRINIYHALCTISLARQTLASLQQIVSAQGNTHRVGLVTPYRKQAELLQQLIQDNGLKDEIRAGTVHKFQGLEFDAVIFDTVESSPLSPVPDFTAGRLGSEAMRLINVAVTRPRYKLIIVANASYIRGKFSEKDIMRLVVEEAQKASVIQSRKILSIPDVKTTDGLKNNSALKFQRYGGVPDASQYEPELLDDRTFFDRFIEDVRLARKRIVIYSPFLDIQRTSQIAPALGKKRGEGIRVVVIASKSRDTDPTTSKAALLLKEKDVELRTLSGMHQKLVFIDDEIVYTGSLNVLSHTAITEFMERVNSPKFVKKIWQFMNVETVTQAPAKWGPEIKLSGIELPDGGVCEKCSNDLILKFGKYGAFYGCKGYYKGCPSAEEIAEKHLSGVHQLQNVKCEGCKSGALMRIKTHRKDMWLECDAPTPCGYQQRITITNQRKTSF